MHDGNGDKCVEVGRVGCEADYGNAKVWSLEFPRLLKDLKSLILNRLTWCAGSSQLVCLCKLKKRTLNPFTSVRLSLTLIDSSSVKVSAQPHLYISLFNQYSEYDQ